MNKEYTVALYIRLSLEDGNGVESNSVVNQRTLLNDFLDKHPGLSACKRVEMCDDGVSGTSFDRPDIKKLLQMAQKGEIQCIVVKDISRFGRNYIEVGNYIEKVFPFLDIRFISVNDSYDSADSNSSIGALEVSLRTLVYDLYSKDLSEKTKSAKRTKMKKGENIGKAVFGYKKSKTEKHKLVIDEEPARIVRYIFDLALSGKGTTEIVKVLNSEKIPTKCEFKDYMANKKDSEKKPIWTPSLVLRVLKDLRYTGAVVNGIHETTSVGSNKLNRLPKEKWFIVPDMHEAIVTKEEFELVESIRRKISNKPLLKSKKDEARVLYNKVKCHHCDRAMVRRGGINPYYICGTPMFTDSSECVQGQIEETVIENILLTVIKQHLSLAEKNEDIEKEQIYKRETKKSEMRKFLRQFQESIEKLNNTKQQYYEDYCDEKIEKVEYLRLKAECDVKIAELTIKSEVIAETLLPNSEIAKQEQEIPPGMTILTRESVDALVEKITVYDSERIEIVFKYADILK